MHVEQGGIIRTIEDKTRTSTKRRKHAIDLDQETWNFEKQHLKDALAANPTLKATAQSLGLKLSTFYRRLKKHDLLLSRKR